MDWDEYFINIAEAIAKKSHCLSRQTGAIAVRYNRFVVATGYNGPPAGYPHCGDKYVVDGKVFVHTFSRCPRHRAGYKSGEGLDICPAAHAERNVIAEAARLGITLDGCVLYLSAPYPCRECAKEIVNAGIKEIVLVKDENYPEIGLSGKEILDTCGVKVRVMSQDC